MTEASLAHSTLYWTQIPFNSNTSVSVVDREYRTMGNTSIKEDEGVEI